MTARRPTHLSIEQCAEIADVCIAAHRPELISAFIRHGTRPEDVRQLVARPTSCATQFNAEKQNMQVSKEAAVERFSFASLSGEAEIAQ
jgi:hypothetical protein